MRFFSTDRAKSRTFIDHQGVQIPVRLFLFPTQEIPKGVPDADYDQAIRDSGLFRMAQVCYPFNPAIRNYDSMAN